MIVCGDILIFPNHRKPHTPSTSMTKPTLTTLKWIFTTLALALGTTLASAHPGHDLRSESVVHLLTSPYHVLTLALLGSGLFLGAAFIRNLVPRRALQFAGSAALAVAVITALGQIPQ
jgi:hypothetical protein